VREWGGTEYIGGVRSSDKIWGGGGKRGGRGRGGKGRKVREHLLSGHKRAGPAFFGVQIESPDPITPGPVPPAPGPHGRRARHSSSPAAKFFVAQPRAIAQQMLSPVFFLDQRLGLRQRFIDRETARDTHSLDVCPSDRMRAGGGRMPNRGPMQRRVVGARIPCQRGRRPFPRCPETPRVIAQPPPPAQAHERLRDPARIIAEPGPHSQDPRRSIHCRAAPTSCQRAKDFSNIGARTVFDARSAADDFRQPSGIWIGAAAGHRTPWAARPGDAGSLLSREAIQGRASVPAAVCPAFSLIAIEGATFPF